MTPDELAARVEAHSTSLGEMEADLDELRDRVKELEDQLSSLIRALRGGAGRHV